MSSSNERMEKSSGRAPIMRGLKIYPLCHWRSDLKSMSHDIKSAERPAPDDVLTAIADYALSYEIVSALAYETAAYCLMDTLACGFQALKYPACTKLMGPVVPGATLTGGARGS